MKKTSHADFYFVVCFKVFIQKSNALLASKSLVIPLSMTSMVLAMRACLNLNLVVTIPLGCYASFQSEAEEQRVTMLMQKSLQI